jgi:cell division protein ZipA
LRVDNEHDDEKAIAAEEAEEAEEAIPEESEEEELAVPVVESMSVTESVAEPPKSAQPPEPEPAPAPELPPPITTTVRPVVEWPPEDQRKLVSLRLVARPPERFRGSLVRQALAAEGFVLGDLDIFHKPDAQNRAVLSAASLTKPGTFDLETMDTQRYVGLNLFAVLPGPKTPQKAFEELLLTARTLNERLEGALQDERGGPLTPTRVQALRDALGAEAKS